MGNKTSASQDCDPLKQGASTGESAASPCSSPPSVPVSAAAGADSSHRVAADHGGGSLSRGGASSSHSAVIRRSRGAAAAAPAVAPVSLSAPASALADATKGYHLLRELPLGLAALAADYFTTEEYRSLQREGMVPKKETVMLVLSNTVFDTMYGHCEYIPSTEDQQGFQMPSNRRHFSFLTRSVTVPAILELLSPSFPWSISMLTIILDSKTLAASLSLLIAMLPDITSALEHIKYVVLIVNRVQFVFSIGKAPGARTPAEIDRDNGESVHKAINSISGFPDDGPQEAKFKFYLSVLDKFPTSVSHSCVLSSITIAPMVCNKKDLAVLEALISNLEKPFDIRLKITADLDHDFLVKPEIKKFLPYFSHIVVEVTGESKDPIILDFSNLDRVTTLEVRSPREKRIADIIWPSNGDSLETIELRIERLEGGLTFPHSKPFPRVRKICFSDLPKGGFITRLDSTVFPALEQISCSSVNYNHGATLDLSGIKHPGLKLLLRLYRGALILPTVELERINTESTLLGCAAITTALPRVRDLDFWGNIQEHFRALFGMLKKTSEVAGAAGIGDGNHAAAGGGPVVVAASASAEDAELLVMSDLLERLKIGSTDIVNIRMGAFMYLQSLELSGISVILDGRNFPLLHSLRLSDRGDVQVIGEFPCLFSLKLKNVKYGTGVHCVAPILHELELDCMFNAANVFIGRGAFPLLRSMGIKANHEYAVSSLLPKFAPDVSHTWSKAITVRVGVRYPRPSSLHEFVELIREKLPGCSILSSIIE